MGNSVAKNSSFLLFSSIVIRGLGFGTSVVLARVLGPDSYGQYSFAIALVTLVAIFWNFGLNTIVTREIAADPTLTGKYIASATILKTILLAPVVLGVMLYLLSSDRHTGMLIPVLLFILSRYYLDIATVFGSAFSAHRRMGVPSILNTIRALVLFLGVIVVSLYGAGLVEVFSCYAISSAVVVIIGAFYVRSLCPSIPWVANIKTLLDLLVSSMPFFVISALSITLFKVDQLILAEFSTSRQVGLYGSAYTLFEVIISFFPMLVMSAVFPVLSNLHKTNPEKMKTLYLLLLKYFCIVGVPVSCGVALLAPSIMIVLFGQDYAEGGPVLQILGCAIIVFFLTNLMSWTLTAGGHQRLIMISTSIALVLNALLNYLLIPKYGAMAAAYTTLLCEFFQLVMFLAGSNLLSLGSLRLNWGWLRVGLATGIMVGVVVLLGGAVPALPKWCTLGVQIGAGASAYLATIMLLGMVNKNELRLILNA